MPLAWPELTEPIRPQRYAMRSVFRRSRIKKDVWKSEMHRSANLAELSVRLDHMLETERRGARERKGRQRYRTAPS